MTEQNTNTSSPIQIIGLDVGRGFVKAYSEYNNNKKECIFKSIVSEGRDGIDYEYHTDPIYIEYDGKKLFAGKLAEDEGHLRMSNSKDTKISMVVDDLIAVVLSKIAVAKEVKLMIGVPYKIFNKETSDEVIKAYKGKIYKVEDKIDGGVKEVKIINVGIFREADSALIHALNGLPNMEKPAGLVSIGFRSTELAYYNKGFKFNDRYSTTIELGNRDVLKYVSEILLRDRGINKTVEEIDSSDDYDELKAMGYNAISEQVSQDIEVSWKNLNEMDIYIAGGTALNMTFDEKFKVLEDTQMATAKGLFEIAELRSQQGKF